MLDQDVRDYIDRSVLCWLATTSASGQPNVSPKEIFTDYDENTLLIANIASPGSAQNIKENPRVCVSFVEILVQKGYQLKGNAEVIEFEHDEFKQLSLPLQEMAGDKFPFSSLIKVTVESVKPILAPSYVLYPDSTTEEGQISNAKKQYNLRPE